MKSQCKTKRYASRIRLSWLVHKAKRLPPPTEEELILQTISFVYGNCAMSNPHVTREMVEHVVRGKYEKSM